MQINPSLKENQLRNKIEVMPRLKYRPFVYFNAIVTESQCVKLRNFLDQNITHKNINGIVISRYQLSNESV